MVNKSYFVWKSALVESLQFYRIYNKNKYYILYEYFPQYNTGPIAIIVSVFTDSIRDIHVEYSDLFILNR